MRAKISKIEVEKISEYAGALINEQELKDGIGLRKYKKFHNSIQRAKEFRLLNLKSYPKKVYLVVGSSRSGKTFFSKYLIKRNHLEVGGEFSFPFSESAILDISSNDSITKIVRIVRETNTHMLILNSLQPLKKSTDSILEKHSWELLSLILEHEYFEIQQNGDIYIKDFDTNEEKSEVLWNVNNL